jgi:hypothetical protein
MTAVPDIEVLATPFELTRVIAGNALTFATLDGRQAIVRLATPDELLELHRKACASLGGEPTMSRADAERLTRPLPI